MGKPKGESRGLEYLRKARAQAMEHLLSFFAESARHLDPKTRFLISVVTKVISGSERGVEQYARRALESGASPDEVLDAVLCAYPCAGLTKVVDAVDIILDMGIEGISLESEEGRPAPEESAKEPEAAARPQRAAPVERAPQAKGETPRAGADLEWVPAGKIVDIPPIGGRRVIAGALDLAVFAVNGEILAVDNRCPHRGGSLSEGVVVDGVVTCPLHGWRFDLQSGRNPDRPAAIRTFPVKMEGDHIFIGIERAAGGRV